MDDSVFRVHLKETVQIGTVFQDILIIQDRKMKHLAAHRFDFILKEASCPVMNKEIKLYLRAVHPPVQVHNVIFHPTSVERGKHL